MNGIPAPLFYVSPTQINAQVPFEVTGDTASVVVERNGVQTATAVVPISSGSPGVFTQSGDGKGAATVLKGTRLASPDNPASPDDVLVLYCTGLGQVRPAIGSGQPGAAQEPLNRTQTAPVVSIGGVAAEVLYSGLAPGFVGLYQINFRVPAGTGFDSAVPLSVSVGSARSNVSSVPIQRGERPSFYVTWAGSFSVLASYPVRESWTASSYTIEVRIENIQSAWYEVTVLPVGPQVIASGLPQRFILGPRQIKDSLPAITFGRGESVAFFADATGPRALRFLALDFIFRLVTGEALPVTLIDGLSAAIGQFGGEAGSVATFLVELADEIADRDLIGIVSSLISVPPEVLDFFKWAGVSVSSSTSFFIPFLVNAGRVVELEVLTLVAPKTDTLVFTASR